MLLDQSPYEVDVTLELLDEELHCNREIEFMLREILYFAEPCTDRPLPPIYKIWDVKAHVCIFEGNIAQMFAFEFPGGGTLESDFELFTFLYIY